MSVSDVHIKVQENTRKTKQRLILFYFGIFPHSFTTLFLTIFEALICSILTILRVLINFTFKKL